MDLPMTDVFTYMNNFAALTEVKNVRISNSEHDFTTRGNVITWAKLTWQSSFLIKIKKHTLVGKFTG